MNKSTGTGSGLLRDEVAGGVTRLLALQSIFTLILLIMGSLGVGYYLFSTELEYKKNIISNRISAELSSITSSLDGLANAPMLWTALTDTTDGEAYLTPLLQSLNRTDTYEVHVLDYRGRPVVAPPKQLLTDAAYESFVRRNVGGQGLSLSMLGEADERRHIGVLFPIISPVSESVVGHLLSVYSLQESLQQLQLSEDIQIGMSFGMPGYVSSDGAWRVSGFFDISTVARNLISTPSGDYVFYVEVTESYWQPVLLFMALLTAIMLGGIVVIRRGRRWASDFSVRTLSRFEQLIELSRQIVRGESVKPLHDDRDDEISVIRATLSKLLTDQRHTLEKLQTSASVFMTAGEAIMITSHDGKIMEVNPALLNMTGYTRDELIGYSAGKLYVTDGAKPDTLIAQALSQSGHWRGETVFYDKQGAAVPVQLAVTRIFDDEHNARGQVAVFTDIREIKAAEEKLRQMAYQDPLTGLPNYRAFSEAVNARLSLPDADKHPFLLLFVDLDRIRQINDFFGHERGDQVIQDLAQHISRSLPEGQLLCRRSGDEFLALVDYADEDELALIRRKLDRRLSTFSIAMEMETLHTGSISAGVTMFPKFSQTLTTLMQQADAALYEAKRMTSAKKVVWYSQEMDDQIRRRLKIETILEAAITNGAIVAHFQPEVEIPSGKVIGFEALARWHDPQLGHVSPAEFIPVAEDNGLIGALTQSMATQVLDAMPLIRAHIKDATVSINVTPQLFLGRQITEALVDLMDDREADMTGLCIEITESHLSQHLSVLSTQLHTMRGLGIQIAIDDFGKGYSSFSRLTNIPLDKLKIDASFVSGSGNRVQKDIIDVIMTLARHLNLSVTAEGVETERQMKMLVEAGCYRAQGWYYSKALTLEQVLEMPSHLTGKRDTVRLS